MTRYFQRSLKYFVALSVIYFVIIYAMSATSLMVMSPEETFASLFNSSSGFRMVGAMLVLALAYPFFGFSKRSIEGSVALNRVEIEEVMLRQGFKLIEEREGKLIYGAGNFFRRLTLLFEDYLVLTQREEKIEVAGNNRSVAYMLFRLEYAIGRSKDETNKPAEK